MIELAVAEKRFGDRPILRDVALQIAPGDCVALMGPSGIGKSTLLRIAAGLDTDFDGQAQAPKNCAMVFQEPTLLPWRTVSQNLTLFHPHLTAVDVAQMLERVGLEGREALFPGQLSLGQQRRLALARAFAGAPQALFLDEPFASLNAELAEDMLTLTQDLITEIRPAVFFITHAPAEAQRLAARILHLAGHPATLQTD